jgi:hypothetical protein
LIAYFHSIKINAICYERAVIIHAVPDFIVFFPILTGCLLYDSADRKHGIIKDTNGNLLRSRKSGAYTVMEASRLMRGSKRIGE